MRFKAGYWRQVEKDKRYLLLLIEALRQELVRKGGSVNAALQK